MSQLHSVRQASALTLFFAATLPISASGVEALQQPSSVLPWQPAQVLQQPPSVDPLAAAALQQPAWLIETPQIEQVSPELPMVEKESYAEIGYLKLNSLSTQSDANTPRPASQSGQGRRFGPLRALGL